MDDFEHRLLVGCLMTAQNEYIHEDKPIDDEPTKRPIGIWGQRHLRHLKQHHKTVYAELMTSGKLNGYLADLNEQAEDMFLRLVKELAEFDIHIINGRRREIPAAVLLTWILFLLYDR